MNTHTITPKQLDKLVEQIEEEFADYFAKSKSGSIRDCFYKPDMYEEQGLYALKDDALSDYPDDLRQKTHNLIVSLTSVD